MVMVQFEITALYQANRQQIRLYRKLTTSEAGNQLYFLALSSPLVDLYRQRLLQIIT